MPKVFISYVRENSEKVLQIVKELEDYGIEVWFDKTALKPGVRWADAIREGIEEGDFFIACFSEEYSAKMKSYMNEELTLAIEELRQRPANQTWFIPVLLSKAEIPNRSIGAGETLRSIQWVELYEDWREGVKKIASSIIPKTEWKPFELPFPDGSTMVLLPLKSNYRGRAYFISKYPITNAQYKKFVDSNSDRKWVKPPAGQHFQSSMWKGPFYPWKNKDFNAQDKPVVCVSHEEAVGYCYWLKKQLSYGTYVSLPNHKIWDFAAFGTATSSPNSGDWFRQGAEVYHKERMPASIDLSGKRLNRRGVSDMIGNVWEWCDGAPVITLAPSRGHAELRGGGFLDDLTRTPPFVNSSRLKDELNTRHSDLGFRISAQIDLDEIPVDVKQNLLLLGQNYEYYEY